MSDRKVLKDTSLMELTLRRYEKPYSLSDRELLKKFALSIGVLQPGDSRDIIVEIIAVLIEAKRHKKLVSSEEIRELVIKKREELGLPQLGIASSNIRRQTKRLRDILFVEKKANKYRITEFSSFENIFNERVKQYMLESITERIGSYTKEIDNRFKNY